MNRRRFLRQTTGAAMALPWVRLPPMFQGGRMGIIVHSYAHRWNGQTESKLYPPFKNATELIAHCHAIGAGGVQVMVRGWSADFSRKVREQREALGMYLEGSVAVPKDSTDVRRFEEEIIAAREAGASVVRTVCLSGRRYEMFRTREEFLDFRKKSIASLYLAEPVVRKHKTKLAVENHKDWRASEMLEILKEIDSEWIGVNLDFGNNIALIEDPEEVAEALMPFIFTTHVKDMGVEDYDDGFLLSEVPLGDGLLDLKKIFALCRTRFADVRFNLEMITRDPLKIPCLTTDYWATFENVSPGELARTLRLVREHRRDTPLPRIAHLSAEERLAIEEQNILRSLGFSKKSLGLK